MLIGITGGSGFIGRNLYETIKSRETSYHVRILDLAAPGFTIDDDDAFFKGDVRDSDITHSFVRDVDVLIHLAAAHKDEGVEEAEYYDVNENGTRVLLDACTKNGVQKLIFTSSVAVYGKTYADDNTEVKPESPYGKSKLAAEELICSWVKETNARAVILRPTVVIGKYNIANMYNLITTIDNGNKRFYVGKEANIKSVASVYELVEFILHIIDNMAKLNNHVETFNFVSYPQLQLKETTNIICRELGKPTPLVTIPAWWVIFCAQMVSLLCRMLGRYTPASAMRVRKLITQTRFEAHKKQSCGFLSNQTSDGALVDMVRWYKEYKRNR